MITLINVLCMLKVDNVQVAGRLIQHDLTMSTGCLNPSVCNMSNNNMNILGRTCVIFLSEKGDALFSETDPHFRRLESLFRIILKLWYFDECIL